MFINVCTIIMVPLLFDKFIFVVLMNKYLHGSKNTVKKSIIHKIILILQTILYFSTFFL